MLLINERGDRKKCGKLVDDDNDCYFSVLGFLLLKGPPIFEVLKCTNEQLELFFQKRLIFNV